MEANRDEFISAVYLASYIGSAHPDNVLIDEYAGVRWVPHSDTFDGDKGILMVDAVDLETKKLVRRIKVTMKDVPFSVRIPAREYEFRTNLLAQYFCEVSKDGRDMDASFLEVYHDGYYHFPNFQVLNPDLASYANVAMGSYHDPWAVLEWWNTKSYVIDCRPISAYWLGKLTKDDIDRICKYEME